MSGGPSTAGTGKKQKWGWSRYVYIRFRVIFFSNRMRKFLSYVCESYVCVHGLDLWCTRVFIYVYCLFLYYLGFMLIFLSTVFIVGLSWIVLVIRRSFISVSLSSTHTHTRARKYTHSPYHAHSEQWQMCGVLRLQRRGDAGSMLNVGLGIQTRPAWGQTIYCFKDFHLQQVYCPGRRIFFKETNK